MEVDDCVDVAEGVKLIEEGILLSFCVALGEIG